MTGQGDLHPADRGLAEIARRYAASSISRFGLPPDCRLTLLRYGENGVFRVDTREGEQFALRVHRPGYQTPESIRSELQWMIALRDEGIETPRAVAGRDGDLVQTVSPRDGEPSRSCVLFEWVDGDPIGGSESPAVYELLGGIMARMHRQAEAWTLPPAFTRQRWDDEGLVGAAPLFGNFADATDWPAEIRSLLDEAHAVVRDKLRHFGQDVSRFGLIHADVTPWNIMIHGGAPYVLDFDDCGFGWYLFDVATSLWPHEGRGDYDGLQQAFLSGYRRERAIAAEDLALLPVFFMARRFAGLGWIASRQETAHARTQAGPRIASTAAALGRFMRWAAAQ